MPIAKHKRRVSNAETVRYCLEGLSEIGVQLLETV
jgi:hypothetical protein